jgi:FkbM family methyltransferase
MENLKNFILGNKALQKLWWALYKISLKGMNYDRGHVPSANGEDFAIKFALKNLNNDRVFVVFDVGANRGQYLQMALNAVPSSRNYKIYCFEPQKDAFATLSTSASGNKNVVLENIALGSNSSRTTLYKNSAQSEFGSMYKANYSQYNTELSMSEEIEVTTIDKYCNEYNIHTIDFLKLDVEGHEIEALKGAKTMLDNGNIEFIQFEFGLASIESRIFLKDFFSLLSKYEIYRILPHGLERIHYSEYHELFLTTNYLAKKK